ncbi:MAG: phage baseplate assembly protein V [Solirubrobacteraceae bacterium]
MTNLGEQGYREEFNLFGDPNARFFGKYRGAVVNNIDPLGQGRLLVRVPDVLRFFPSSWALPCVPLAGPLMGMYVVPPPVGAGVWVEFEQGNPDKPIWVGCFWDGPAALPGKQGMLAAKLGAGRQVVTIETGTSGISVSETPLPIGTVSLYSGPAVSIEIGTSTITLTAPSVSIITEDFSINGAQFTVI